jgi:hypothetical protein
MPDFDIDKVHKENLKRIRDIAVGITKHDPEDDPADDELVPPEYRGIHKDEEKDKDKSENEK